MEQSVDTILETGEKKIWQGKIKRDVLVFNLIIGLVVATIIGSIVFFSASSTTTRLIGVGIWVIGFIAIIVGYFRDLIQEYTITNKRVVMKSGIIGTDFKSIYFDQIKNIIVDVGLIGKMFSVGTIKIDTGKTNTYSSGGGTYTVGNQTLSRSGRVQTKTMYDMIRYIEQPYEVYKNLQSVLSKRKESLYSGKAYEASMNVPPAPT